MQLRTYTSLWSTEKRLYKLYDVQLPYAVSVRQIVVFVGFTLPWLMLMSNTPIPVTNPFGFLVWAVPPVGFTYGMTRPVAEGKNLWEYLYSQARFWLGGRDYACLRAVPRARRGTVAAAVWSRH